MSQDFFIDEKMAFNGLKLEYTLEGTVGNNIGREG